MYLESAARRVSIPRTRFSIWSRYTVSKKSNLMPGDLVFFSSSGGRITHVSIYVGGRKYDHSPQTGDVVKLSSTKLCILTQNLR